ncbi:hypothetical protein BDV18DRAFT_152420 [Aspergillus unguis]
MFSANQKACGRYMRQFCHWRAVEMRAYARRAQKTVGHGSARDGIGCDAGQLPQQTRGESGREGLSNRSLVVEEIQY